MSPTLLLCPTLHVALEHGAGQVRAFRRREPFAPVYVLLPGEEAIRQWGRQLGSCIGVHLVQFHSLAQVVLRQGHRALHRAHPDEQLQIISDVLADLSTRPDTTDGDALTTFAGVAKLPGMARALLDWLHEMGAQRIAPWQLSRQARLSGSVRDGQLAAIYRAYTGTLAHRRKADGDQLILWAAHALAQDAALFAGSGMLIVAGFDQFSPVQLALLGALCRRLPSASIYLLWEEAQAADGLALSRLRQTRDDLAAALRPTVQALPESEAERAPLQHLRRVLFRPAAAPGDDPASVVRAVEAPSREAEVRWALRQAKRLLLSGARADGIALLAPRRDAYERTVAAVAFEYGVPVRLEQALADNPAVAAFASLASLAPDYSRRETIDALRSPYLEQRWLDAEQVSLLDRLTRERPVVAGQEQWQSALQRPPVAAGDDEVDDERARASLLAQLPEEQVAAIRQGLQAFFGHLTPHERGTRTEHTLWLQEAVLGLFTDAQDGPEGTEARPSLHLARCCQSGPHQVRDVGAVAGLARALSGMVLSDKAASGPIPWEQYREELLARLAATNVPGGGAAPAVYFDHMGLGRHLAVEHLFVLGLSEGEFPSLPAADAFYSEEERRRYPLPLVRRDPAEDACLWWQVLASANTSVTLLRPRFDDGGAPWPASPYWDAALAAIAGLERRVESLPIGASPAVNEAASACEMAVALAAGGADGAPPAIAAAWIGARAAHAVWRQRRGWLALGPYEGIVADADLRATLSDRFGPRRRWSVSRLSRYGGCPYSFFAEHVLGLEALEEPEAGMDARIRGSLLHALLERVYHQATDADVSPCVSSEAAMLGYLDAACAAIFPPAPERFGFRPTALWRHEQQELRRLLGALLRSECRANGDAPRFHPRRQEVRFGFPGADLPALALDDGSGSTLLLRGIIDRIDVDDGGALSIVDYKSGSTRLRQSDVTSGRAMQGALYPLAALHLFPEARVAESYYLHIASREQSGKLSFENGGNGPALTEAATAQAHLFAAGARRGRFPIATDAAACEYCDFAALCRVDRIARARVRRSGAE